MARATESWLADECNLARVDGAFARAEEERGSCPNDLVRFSSVCTKASQRKRLRGRASRGVMLWGVSDCVRWRGETCGRGCTECMHLHAAYAARVCCRMLDSLSLSLPHSRAVCAHVRELLGMSGSMRCRRSALRCLLISASVLGDDCGNVIERKPGSLEAVRDLPRGQRARELRERVRGESAST